MLYICIIVVVVVVVVDDADALFYWYDCFLPFFCRQLYHTIIVVNQISRHQVIFDLIWCDMMYVICEDQRSKIDKEKLQVNKLDWYCIILLLCHSYSTACTYCTCQANTKYIQSFEKGQKKIEFVAPLWTLIKKANKTEPALFF